MSKNTNPPKGRHGLKWALIAMVGLFVGLFAYRDATKGVSVRSADVTTGSIAAFVEERAFTSLPNIFHITMPMQGRIEPIHVSEGDAVEKGQLVATIEDVDWQDASDQMDDLVNAMTSAVAATAAEIKASEARTEYTEWVWQANEGTEGVSERDARRSKWEYLDSVVKTEGSNATFHTMAALLSATRIMRPFISRSLERTDVKSPVSGVVLKRHVWNEKVMLAGEALLDIGDLSQLEVTAEILSGEASRIHPGDRVVIFGEAIGETPLTGSVRKVEPEAFTKLSSLGVEQQRVNVRISFDEEGLAKFSERGNTLGLGFRTRVRVITDEKEDAIIVPRTSVFRSGEGQWSAYRIEDGKARLVEITTGLRNDLHVEILSGLEPGQILVDAPETGIEDGVRLAIIE